MTWSEIEPGDFVEYKMPNSKKMFGIFLGIKETSFDFGVRRYISVMGTELNDLQLITDEDLDIKVSVRSSIADSEG